MEDSPLTLPRRKTKRQAKLYKKKDYANKNTKDAISNRNAPIPNLYLRVPILSVKFSPIRSSDSLRAVCVHTKWMGVNCTAKNCMRFGQECSANPVQIAFSFPTTSVWNSFVIVISAWVHIGTMQKTACDLDRNRTAFLYKLHAILCSAISVYSFSLLVKILGIATDTCISESLIADLLLKMLVYWHYGI